VRRWVDKGCEHPQCLTVLSRRGRGRVVRTLRHCMADCLELSDGVFCRPRLSYCTSGKGACRLHCAQELRQVWACIEWPSGNRLSDLVVASERCCRICAGHRSRVYSLLFSCATAAAGIGPLFATAVFMATGNRWTQVVSIARRSTLLTSCRLFLCLPASIRVKSLQYWLVFA